MAGFGYDRRERKRKNDRREWISSLIFGAAFWVCIVGSVIDKLNQTEGWFRVTLMGLLVTIIASVCLMTLFMAFVGHRHLRANWNDRAELEKAGGAVIAALRRMNAVSILTFGLILWVCFFVDLTFLSVALLCSTIVMVGSVVIIALIGNHRAAKL